MIRPLRDEDRDAILEVVNDAAEAYRGVIPADRWRVPYMPAGELAREIGDGVEFWGFEVSTEDGPVIVGVMGIQDRGEVTLIRHAYVLTRFQGEGIGTRLLRHLEERTEKSILIGTWADASWAVAFYEKNGYRMVAEEEKDRLLRRYWHIPDRQIETSVVLARRTISLLGSRSVDGIDHAR